MVWNGDGPCISFDRSQKSGCKAVDFVEGGYHMQVSTYHGQVNKVGE